jgi:putative ATP-binding cassette transporter
VTQTAVDFAVGILCSVLLLFGFFAVLWTLSGTLRLSLGGTDLAIPGYLVIAALIYAVIGTTCVHLLGKQLTPINEKRRRREGNFRSALLRVHDNSEGIAFLRGEDTERAGLHTALDRILSVWRKLRRATRRVTWATSAYSIVAPIFPLLVAAPQFLTGEMTLGGLMQASLAFVQVQTALGWFVDNYARLSDWRAGANRILALDGAGKVIAEEPDDEQETRIKLQGRHRRRAAPDRPPGRDPGRHGGDRPRDDRDPAGRESPHRRRVAAWARAR